MRDCIVIISDIPAHFNSKFVSFCALPADYAEKPAGFSAGGPVRAEYHCAV